MTWVTVIGNVSKITTKIQMKVPHRAHGLHLTWNINPSLLLPLKIHCRIAAKAC